MSEQDLQDGEAGGSTRHDIYGKNEGRRGPVHAGWVWLSKHEDAPEGPKTWGEVYANGLIVILTPDRQRLLCELNARGLVMSVLARSAVFVLGTDRHRGPVSFSLDVFVRETFCKLCVSAFLFLSHSHSHSRSCSLLHALSPTHLSLYWRMQRGLGVTRKQRKIQSIHPCTLCRIPEAQIGYAQLLTGVPKEIAGLEFWLN